MLRAVATATVAGRRREGAGTGAPRPRCHSDRRQEAAGRVPALQLLLGWLLRSCHRNELEKTRSSPPARKRNANEKLEFVRLRIYPPMREFSHAGGSTGAVFNPALAYSITFNCTGNTYLEYCIVYWLGPLMGAMTAILLFGAKSASCTTANAEEQEAKEKRA